MKAVAYARYSSDKQDEVSIQAQLRAIREYAERQGIEIVRIYSDEAKSALSDDRPEFQRLFSELSAGDGIDYVFVHKLDRFARNRYDAAIYRRKLQEAGKRLIAVDQPTDDSPEGGLLENLLEALAEYYSRNLARETMKGMRERARERRHMGGCVPYGYTLDEDKHYVIQPAEAEGIRLAFDMLLDGKSYGEICQALNAQGHRTRRGGPWTKTALHETFRNPKYAGIYVYNRAQRRIGGKWNWRREKDKSEQIIIEGGVPAIVEPEKWHRVQGLMDKRVRPRTNVVERYLLTGKLKCGLCGAPCVGTSRTTRGQKYRYYECTRKKRFRTCTLRSWPKNVVEDTIMSKLRSELLTPESLERIAVYVSELVNRDKERATARAESLMAALQDTQNRITKLLQAIEEGVIDWDMARDRIKELRDRRAQFEAEFEKAGARALPVSPGMVLEYLNTLKNKSLAELVDSWVVSAVLHNDRCEVNVLCAYAGAGSAAPTYTHTFDARSIPYLAPARA